MPNTPTMTEAEAYNAICWSADVDDLETLLGHLDRMPRLRRIKIDRAFVEANGWDVFHVLASRGNPLDVFFDAKYVEIPPKLEKLVKNAVMHHSMWMVNCMAGSLSSLEFELTGKLTPDDIDGLKRFADVCHKAGVRPCAVSVLTTKTDAAVKREFNGRNRNDQVLDYADVVLGAGFTDMVCSPLELPVIRAESRFDVLCLDTPAIRPAGASKDDQVNASTPAGALAVGSNLLVIGRPITTGDPAENVDNIVAEILAA